MLRSPPPWWYGKEGAISSLLAPLAVVYGWGVKARWRLTRGYCSRLPVICIGNLTAGGAGKTPTAIAIGEWLARNGERPAFLTRGFGGRIAGPHLVNLDQDLPHDVGDEPILLARTAPTVVSANRPAGARFIEELDCSVIIMDDGFQNPSLVKQVSLIVLDGEAGIGNGRVIPAGPLRAPLSFQLEKADGFVIIGGKAEDKAIDRLSNITSSKPCFHGIISARQNSEWLTKAPIIAYCGIGRPEKFFTTLEALGAQILERHAFPDHHTYQDREASELLAHARKTGAMLVTTEKDQIRLSTTSGPLGALRATTRVLSIYLTFEGGGDAKLMAFLKKKMEASKGPHIAP